MINNKEITKNRRKIISTNRGHKDHSESHGQRTPHVEKLVTRCTHRQC